MRTLAGLLFVLPLCGQLRSIEMSFEGIGCASCLESLPGRLGRIRGIESATVDTKAGLLRVKLAEQNRVRVEQIRDMVEQDGTRATSAAVSIAGELKREDGSWVLRPPAGSYVVEGAELTEGRADVSGRIEDLHAGPGPLRIKKRS